MKVVHYVNQFFAGMGGEDKAGLAPVRLEGPVGPGRGLGLPIDVSIACGDDYFGEFESTAVAQILEWIVEAQPDVIICGPAFGSGRYGYACAVIAREAARRGIPAVTGLHPENPGVAAAEGWVYIIPTPSTLTGMRVALPAMANIARRLALGEPVGTADEEGYLPQSKRQNRIADHTGADRAVELLLGKLSGHVETELVPRVGTVVPAPPVQNLASATIALVTESGCVPTGNPDRVPSRRAHRWFRYSIAISQDMLPAEWETIHGGYDTTAALAEPERLVPLGALRRLEAQGRIAGIHPWLYTMAGVDTTVANAARFGQEIGAELQLAGVDGVVLTGT